MSAGWKPKTPEQVAKVKAASKRYRSTEKFKARRRELRSSLEAKEKARNRYKERRQDPSFVADQRRRAREYRANNLESVLAKGREAARRPENKKRHAARERLRALGKRFGVTAEQLDQKLSSQRGRCAICGSASCPSGRSLSLDHCHESGSVRGLLCVKCNTGLGAFNDDPGLLQSAVRYLRAWRFKVVA